MEGETRLFTLLESKKVNYDFNHLSSNRELVIECSTMKESEVKVLDEVLTEKFGAQLMEEDMLEEGWSLKAFLAPVTGAKVSNTPQTGAPIQKEDITGAIADMVVNADPSLALSHSREELLTAVKAGYAIAGTIATVGAIPVLSALKDVILDWFKTKGGKPSEKDFQTMPDNVKVSFDKAATAIDSNTEIKQTVANELKGLRSATDISTIQKIETPKILGSATATQPAATAAPVAATPAVQKEARENRLRIALLKEKIEKRTGKKVVLKK